jgi:hypothetical protein
MRHTELRGSVIGAVVALAGLLAWPATGTAQLGVVGDPLPSPTGSAEPTATADAADATVVGQASGVRATTLGLLGGTTTVLADTGALEGTSDARGAGLVTGSVPSLLGAEALNATTIGWPDQVASEASVANLGLIVGGIGIFADFVMARATGLLGAAGSGSSLVENLSVNGVPISVTGQPNQTVSIPGGLLVINEQTVSGADTTVNALHATVFGVADVVIASATAGVQ